MSILIGMIILGVLILALSVLLIKFSHFWVVWLWLGFAVIFGCLLWKLPTITSIIIAMVFCLALAVLTSPMIRYRSLTRWLWAILSKQHITISPTESAVIDSGQTHWEKKFI